MKTFEVEVKVVVDVTIDETKFTPEFLAEFANTISDYSLDEHVCHLAWLHVCREIDMKHGFVEGYGPELEKNFGVKVANEHTNTEVLREVTSEE